MFTAILLLVILIVLFLCMERNKMEKQEEKEKDYNKTIKEKPHFKEDFVNTDKIYLQYPYIGNDFADSEKKTEKIKFNYNQRPVDREFIKEQKEGVNYNTWYSNTWIQKIGPDGKPIYNSRENVTGKKEELVEEHTRMTYDFNAPKSINMDGVIDPDAIGTKISDVYDNYFVDYKKLTPEKKMLNCNNPDETTTRGASNLSFYSPDTWVYENEKPENGGMIENGLFGADLNNMDPVAKYEDNMNAF